jgi:uncharacterized iron-regulated protein
MSSTVRSAWLGVACAAAMLATACAGRGSDAVRAVDAASAGSVVPASTAAAEPVVKLVGGDHPLAGRIWSTREGRFVAPARVEAAVRDARFALLGERHGNPQHHVLQGRLVAAAARGGRRVALVAEQLDFDQQPAIDACRRDCVDFGAELGARVNWAGSGWPDYPLYRPIFKAAGTAHASVYAGNAGAKRIRSLSRAQSPAPDEAAWVARAREPLAPLGRGRLVEDLKDGHCGHLPAEYADALVFAQRLRDASMTATLRRAADAADAADRPATVVLVAGTGHARRDYGVPTLLGERDVVVVAFVEVAPGETRARKYGSADAYDYLWFTPRVDEPDPCEQFRQRLEKMNPTAGTANR